MRLHSNLALKWVRFCRSLRGRMSVQLKPGHTFLLLSLGSKAIEGSPVVGHSSLFVTLLPICVLPC